MSTKPNLPQLRERYVSAWRAWRDECAARGIDIYDDEAEGANIGRGKARTRCELGKLFDAMNEARAAYQGGGAIS